MFNLVIVSPLMQMHIHMMTGRKTVALPSQRVFFVFFCRNFGFYCVFVELKPKQGTSTFGFAQSRSPINLVRVLDFFFYFFAACTSSVMCSLKGLLFLCA